MTNPVVEQALKSTSVGQPNGLPPVRKEAWPFYRTSFGVCLCWELKESQGPKVGSELRPHERRFDRCVYSRGHAQPLQGIPCVYAIWTIPPRAIWLTARGGLVQEYPATGLCPSQGGPIVRVFWAHCAYPRPHSMFYLNCSLLLPLSHTLTL